MGIFRCRWVTVKPVKYTGSLSSWLCLLCKHVWPNCTVLAPLQSICFHLLLSSTSEVPAEMFYEMKWLANIARKTKPTSQPVFSTGHIHCAILWLRQSNCKHHNHDETCLKWHLQHCQWSVLFHHFVDILMFQYPMGMQFIYTIYCVWGVLLILLLSSALGIEPRAMWTPGEPSCNQKKKINHLFYIFSNLYDKGYVRDFPLHLQGEDSVSLVCWYILVSHKALLLIVTLYWYRFSCLVHVLVD